jgi:hypothetical protein
MGLRADRLTSNGGASTGGSVAMAPAVEAAAVAAQGSSRSTADPLTCQRSAEANTSWRRLLCRVGVSACNAGFLARYGWCRTCKWS